MSTQHVPRVEIETPAPDKYGATLAIFTRLRVDGQEWMITDFRIDGKVDGLVKVTLSFLGDVTITHPEVIP